MRDRLEAAHHAFVNVGGPLGVLWIGVDQAREMRRTHGAQAFEAMLESVERTLANARRSEEEVGRWGDGEFLMISHERDAEVLANHAQVLAGIARTADFRWWGDRVSLSVSIGAAQAENGDTLSQLLERAQDAMAESMQTGGNRVTPAKGRQACLPSLES
jgi:diguanylate cyclase (GGDEF)-like protein